MLPGALAEPTGRPHRRTWRDWLVDVLLFAVSAWWWDVQRHAYPFEYIPDAPPQWMLDVDPWIGAAACLALWWRRRFPIALTFAMLPVLLFTATGYGAVLVMVLTLAVHRPWPWAVGFTTAFLVLTVPYAFAYPSPEMPPAAYAALVGLMHVVPLVTGLAVRFRRQLVWTLRRDAEIVRQDAERRLESARAAERQRIAREMHDVLAHRLSLLSVHAGALAYRNAQAAAGSAVPVDPEEMAAAIRVIQDNARQALTELTEVLTVLRTPDDSDESAALHRLSDLAGLVDTAVEAGQDVTLRLDATAEQAAGVGHRAGRTVYRIVQEGLTNARKHAPRQPVTVEVSVGDDEAVTVSLWNPRTVVDEAAPESGFGLAGLAERVALAGGELHTGGGPGEFRLTARLPGA